MRRKIIGSAAAGFFMAFGFCITAQAATGWQWDGSDWRYFQKDNEAVTATWTKSGSHRF